MTTTTLSETLSHYVARTQLGAIPTAVAGAARRMMLDTLAVAWAGSAAPGIEQLRRGLVSAPNAGESLLWANLEPVALLDAAFLNGAAAAALDYDGLHLEAVVHTDIVCLPAVLATAERVHASGREFLAALILANEVVCRLGLATRLHSGWFYTSIHGVFGAAAGCAKLLGLEGEGIRDALGIALSQVGGTQQSMVEKALTKRIQSALASRAGAFSALLAQSGVTAPREAFEGRYGFYNLYEAGDPSAVLNRLGERYVSAETSMKKYPSCACNHAVIEATLQLVHEYDLQPGDCLGARAIISPYMNRLVGANYDPDRNPQVAAQFSVQYSVACAVLRRRLGIAEIERESALDPQLREFAGRVEVVVDEASRGELTPGAVELATRSRGILRRQVDHLPGGPGRPLSDAELAAKVEECMALGARPLAPGRIARLSARIAAIEQVEDMARWFDGI
jgi:2-methylcitrate dehydratase PrpD